MISKAYITEWQRHAPWSSSAMVEQDLVICRALVDIFSHPLLKENLAFRGGTALFKLHLSAARYSEDIDLVQVQTGPIGPIMDAIREKLNPWLGEPKWKQTQGRVTFRYRFESEDGIPLNLKVEINSREHFSVYGFRKEPFAVESRWFTGKADILTYCLEELLGTKFRALYQRSKGRDLFDLWYALTEKEDPPDVEGILESFQCYMEHGEQHVSRAIFEENMLGKRKNPQFSGDIHPLLKVDIAWDFDRAFDFVMEALVSRLPGDPWRGNE